VGGKSHQEGTSRGGGPDAQSIIPSINGGPGRSSEGKIKKKKLESDQERKKKGEYEKIEMNLPVSVALEKREGKGIRGCWKKLSAGKPEKEGFQRRD